jgi:predicted metal-dependent enzyme (double-stranded beta helix superfamily)
MPAHDRSTTDRTAVHPLGEPAGSSPASRREAARALHPASTRTTPLDTSVLRDIAAGLAHSVDPDQQAEPWTTRATRLLTTEAYDAWLMVWGPAALSEAHDHDGSVGVVQLVAGSLLETSLGIQASVPTPLRRLEAGELLECPATEFHSLFNPTSGVTVTVNVYSPPLGDRSPETTPSRPK